MLQTVYHTLFQPAIFQSAKDLKASWWQGALMVILVSTLLTLSMGSGWTTQQLAIGLPLAWGQSLLSWWVFALLFHFASDIFGGSGRIQNVLAATGFSVAPLLLWPLLTAFQFQLGALGQTLAVVGAMGLVFWCLVLLGHLLAVSEALSLDRALGALVMTLFLVGVLFVSTVVLSGLQIAFWGASLL
jgi:hypothetical protein